MQAATSGFNPHYSEDSPTLEQVKALQGITLLEFGAPWCGHCQAAASAIKSALTEHADILHLKVYDGKGKRLGREFAVKVWPTLILLQEGIEVARVVRPIHIEDVNRLFAHW